MSNVSDEKRAELPPWAMRPTVAMVLVAFAPSVIVCLLQTLDWIRGVAKPLDIIGVLCMPLLVSVPNLPFLVLQRAVAKRLREELQPAHAVRTTMSWSLAAMLLPNSVVVLFGPSEFRSGETDAGQGTGLFVALEIVLVPVLGIAGWWLGRWRTRSAHRGKL